MILKGYFLKDMIIVLSENKEESTDKEESVDLSDILPLEGDEEEVREGKEMNF